MRRWRKYSHPALGCTESELVEDRRWLVAVVVVDTDLPQLGLLTRPSPAAAASCLGLQDTGLHLEGKSAASYDSLPSLLPWGPEIP